MPRPGSHMFTKLAVQRAMDAQASKWGAPEGYYTVDARLRKLSESEQVWAVRVRLFGGQVRHVEQVIFIHEEHDPYAEIIYGAIQHRYDGPSAHKVPRVQVPVPEYKATAPAGRAKRPPRVLKGRHENGRLRLQAQSERNATMIYTQWTQSEDRTLQMDAAMKVSILETAGKLGRTYYAVSRRRVILGLTTYNRT